MKSNIKSLISNSNSILLLTHETPDGDAIGSVLSLYHYFLSINKTVDMIILDIPKVFNFMTSINNVVDNTENIYDLGIVVDCSTKERIGQKTDLLSKCKSTIAIDHHISNTNYCDYNFVESSVCSCCQVIYYLFKDWNVSLSNNIIEGLAVGMITDTNGFSIDSVDSNTFNMAADIINLGFDFYDVYQRVLSVKTISQYNLMKIGMERLEFFYNNKIAFTYILNEDFEKVGASVGEHEGIVDIGRNIEGVEVSILIRENDGWSVSLRSTGNIDVSKIALLLGGGGHKMAAGTKIKDSFENVKNILVNEVVKALSK